MARSGDATLSAHFDRAAETYEDSYGVMKDIARKTISLVPPITAKSVVHDNACGPGIVTGEILKQAKFARTPKLYATDFSPPMINMVIKKNWSGVQAEVMDAQRLEYPDNMFTHSFTNFAIMAMPDPESAAKQIYRTLKPGGTAVVTTWKFLGYMDILNPVMKAIKPDAKPSQGPLPEEWMTDTKLRKTLETGGFESSNIEIKEASFSQASDTLFSAGDPMKNMMKQLLTVGWSEEEKNGFSTALDEKLADEIKNPRSLEMIAWLAIARK